MSEVQTAKAQKRQQKGFTLVELIVVIVIIGILAAIALGRFGDFSGSATTARNNYKTASNNSHINCISQAGTDTGIAAACAQVSGP